MDEILGFVPGGPWVLGAVALLAVPGVRRSLRPLAKGTIKVTLNLADQVKNLTAEAREQASDIYAEAKSERQESPEAEGVPASSDASPKVAPVGGRKPVTTTP